MVQSQQNHLYSAFMNFFSQKYILEIQVLTPEEGFEFYKTSQIMPASNTSKHLRLPSQQ